MKGKDSECQHNIEEEQDWNTDVTWLQDSLKLQ
jgi:hypothetical protein